MTTHTGFQSQYFEQIRVLYKLLFAQDCIIVQMIYLYKSTYCTKYLVVHDTDTVQLNISYKSLFCTDYGTV